MLYNRTITYCSLCPIETYAIAGDILRRETDIHERFFDRRRFAALSIKLPFWQKAAIPLFTYEKSFSKEGVI